MQNKQPNKSRRDKKQEGTNTGALRLIKDQPEQKLLFFNFIQNGEESNMSQSDSAKTTSAVTV